MVEDTLIRAMKFVDCRLTSWDEQYFDAHREYFRTYFGFWEALEGRSSSLFIYKVLEKSCYMQACT